MHFHQILRARIFESNENQSKTLNCQSNERFNAVIYKCAHFQVTLKPVRAHKVVTDREESLQQPRRRT